MKKAALIFIGLFLICSCAKKEAPSNVLASVNNYEISKAEFELAFQDSRYAKNDTLQAKQEFLNNLINQKLILQEAQRQGLDKEPSFLKLIEKFWEQSLLKTALERKAKEAAGTAKVSDNTIKEAYDNMVKQGKATKPYEAMYSQIKWEISKLKESQKMDDWLVDLKKKAKIKINSGLLK